MFKTVNIDADWNAIRNRKQDIINSSNNRENKNRIAYTYKPGDYVTMAVTCIRPKLSPPQKGPFKIIEAHANVTHTIELEPFLTDRVNIRIEHPLYFLHIPSESAPLTWEGILETKSNRVQTRLSYGRFISMIHKNIEIIAESSDQTMLTNCR